MKSDSTTFSKSGTIKKKRTIDEASRDYVKRLFSKKGDVSAEHGRSASAQAASTKKKKNQERFEDDESQVAKLRKTGEGNISELFVPEYLIEQESEFDVRRLIGRSIDPVTGIPRDMKILDGDFPEAKNYFDFVSNFMGEESRFPFARQAWAMLRLFAEVCPNPKCSHPDWYRNVETLPVDYDARQLPEYLSFFEHGVCPTCKKTKADYIHSGKLNNFVEGNLCWGQRAGKSATVSTGAGYMTHKYLKLPNLSTVCPGIQSNTTLTATFVGYRFTDARDLLWTPIKGLLDDSPWFCLDENTTISLADETQKSIKDMAVGDIVKTIEGTSIVDKVFDNDIKECKLVELEDGASLIGTDQHKVRCLSQDRLSLIWKKIVDLTKNDLVVIE